MSPHEMGKYRQEFNAAAANLGWVHKTVTQEHERDWDCTWQAEVWTNAAGDFLFDEAHLSNGLVKEIIKLGAKQ